MATKHCVCGCGLQTLYHPPPAVVFMELLEMQSYTLFEWESHPDRREESTTTAPQSDNDFAMLDRSRYDAVNELDM
jgi:hypothetical protein